MKNNSNKNFSVKNTRKYKKNSDENNYYSENLDSSGLGALVQTAKECKKLKLDFSVVGNSRVAQTIKLVRLGDFLNLNSSLEEALAYLKS